MDYEKQTVCFLGTGFLTSYMLGPILPFCKKIVLWDHDRINQENYENALYPKGMTGQFKVSALARYLQLMSSVPVQPIHKQMGLSTIDVKLLEETNATFAIVTFDNYSGRFCANMNLSYIKIPFLQVGITENYGLVDWESHFPLPESYEDQDRVTAQMKRIKDVCERIEFRTLGNRIASLAVESMVHYLTTGQKVGFEVNHLLTRQFMRD